MPRLTPEAVLTWLNGRVTNPIIVLHQGRRLTVWDVARGQDGTTIEDAVTQFCEIHGIDVLEEIEGLIDS